MKICFETFGCRLNRSEALAEEARYLAAGHSIVKTHEEADLIVIRGCSVTRRAEHDSQKLIEHLRTKYPTKQLRIEGCLDEKTEAPPIYLQADKSLIDNAIPVSTARAYLKVQDGCSGKCSFCIVPSFRGSSISENFTATIDKAKRFIEAGYHEIVVTGCNLSLYASEGKRLPELLLGIAELSNDCRVRLGSLEPWLAAKEVVDAIAEHENICRFLHIPVQSGSDRILQEMRRPYTVSDIDELVHHAMKRVPDASIGCDIITGFPGESDFDFFSTAGLLKRLNFTNAHVFPYSERPGTLAAGLPLSVPRELRKARAMELSNLVRRARERFAAKHIGREVEIIIEDEKHPSGWTSDYLWCEIKNLMHVKRNHSLRVRVLEARRDKLIGVGLK